MLKHLNLIIIILLLVWISFFPLPIQERYHLAIKIFLGLAFVVLLIRRHTSIFKSSNFPLWFFLIAIGLNIFFAPYREIALRRYLDLALPMFFIYYLAKEVFSSPKGFSLLAKTICILSSLVALGGITEVFLGHNPLYKFFISNPYYERYITGFARSMSTQFNPAALGTYLIASLPFSFFLFKSLRKTERIIGEIGIILNIVCLISTFSRIAFFALIVIGTFYLALKRRYKELGLLLVLLIFIIITFSYFPYPFSRFGISRMFLAFQGAFSHYRITRIKMALSMLKENLFFGVGLRHFRILFDNYFPFKQFLYRIPYEKKIADNMYVTLLAETGIIGFASFIIFISFLFKRALFFLRQQEARSIALTLTASFLSFLITSAGYELFYWPNQYIYFCLIVGLIGSLEIE